MADVPGMRPLVCPGVTPDGNRCESGEGVKGYTAKTVVTENGFLILLTCVRCGTVQRYALASMRPRIFKP